MHFQLVVVFLCNFSLVPLAANVVNEKSLIDIPHFKSFLNIIEIDDNKCKQFFRGNNIQRKQPINKSLFITFQLYTLMITYFFSNDSETDLNS